MAGKRVFDPSQGHAAGKGSVADDAHIGVWIAGTLMVPGETMNTQVLPVDKGQMLQFAAVFRQHAQVAHGVVQPPAQAAENRDVAETL